MLDKIRHDLPLFGVGTLLLLTLVALIVLRQTGTMTPRSAYETATGASAAAPEDVRALNVLPATAKDEAVIESQLAPTDARSQNDAVPIAATKLPPAPPFAFRGSAADRLRARDCLALAALAEAGAGDKDQRAVIQVILNRTRHPAFANTVCGVVFEGSERSTGCQFTFTCDGSLARKYPDRLWQAARARADEALDGYAYQPVGNATHYHTDWVYPWWSSKLDKIAQVNTHLFFRWRGFWGTPAALSARYRGGEPDPAVLRMGARAVSRDELELPVTPEEEKLVAISTDLSPTMQVSGTARSPAPGVFFLLVDPDVSPATLMKRAGAMCPANAYCQVFGWNENAAIPAKLPLSADARQALRFSFVPARGGNREAVFFDCRLWPGAPPGTCLPGSRAATAGKAKNAAPTPKPTASATSKLPSGGTLRGDLDEPTSELIVR